MSGIYFYCETPDDPEKPETETRPYGPGGAPICHPCATATPERAKAAEAAFIAQVEGAAAVSPQHVVLITDHGPEPYVPEGEK